MPNVKTSQIFDSGKSESIKELNLTPKQFSTVQ